jgi:anti-sigma factor RsiW
MTIHPDLKSFLAYQDKQLVPNNARKIAKHLAKCSRCRQRAKQIQTEEQRLNAQCREGPSLEVAPFAEILEMIRAQVTESGKEECREQAAIWPALTHNVTRNPVIGFALAVLLLMSFNTVLFTGLILHPFYAVPATPLVPFSVACMLPAYLVARRVARRPRNRCATPA